MLISIPRSAIGSSITAAGAQNCERNVTKAVLEVGMNPYDSDVGDTHSRYDETCCAKGVDGE